MFTSKATFPQPPADTAVARFLQRHPPPWSFTLQENVLQESLRPGEPQLVLLASDANGTHAFATDLSAGLS